MGRRYDTYGFRDLDLEQARRFVEVALGIQLQLRDSSYVDAFVWPVFDRYYYAPEVVRKGATVDDRALVFCLSIMIAEWATGLYPFAKKHYDSGPRKDDQVALDVPQPLGALLASGMRIDVAQRPTLSAFLSELERC